MSALLRITDSRRTSPLSAYALLPLRLVPAVLADIRRELLSRVRVGALMHYDSVEDHAVQFEAEFADQLALSAWRLTDDHSRPTKRAPLEREIPKEKSRRRRCLAFL
jgi:hypothetical protein